MYYEGKIIKSENGTITIEVYSEDISFINKKNITDCEVCFSDGRKISSSQRKFIYQLMADISKEFGNTPKDTKELMKHSFCKNEGIEIFSLAKINMSDASKFLSFLIDFCVEHQIPTTKPLFEVAEDINRYVYSCVMNGVCCITGRRDALIIAINKKHDIYMPETRVLPLSEIKYLEIKEIGLQNFFKKYKIQDIKLTQDMCNKLESEKKYKNAKFYTTY